MRALSFYNIKTGIVRSKSENRIHRSLVFLLAWVLLGLNHTGYAQELSSDVINIHGAAYGRIAIAIEYDVNQNIAPFFKKQFLKNLRRTALFDLVGTLGSEEFELLLKIKSTAYSGLVLSVLSTDRTEIYRAPIKIDADEQKQHRAIIDLIDRFAVAITGEKTILNSAILYSAKDATGNANIILTDLHASRRHVIVLKEKINILARWSKNAQGFIYTNLSRKGSRIFYYDFLKKSSRLIAHYRGTSAGGSWYHDNEHIALAIGAHRIVNIYKRNIAGLNSKAIPLTRGRYVDTSPSLSNDGNLMIFASNRAGSRNIFSKDFITKEVKRLSFDHYYNDEPVLSNDQNFIAFSGGTLRNLKVNIMTKLGAFRRTLSELPGNSFEPSWAPDDRQLIFTNKKGKKSKLYITTFDGKNTYRLTEEADNIKESSATWTNEFDWSLVE